MREVTGENCRTLDWVNEKRANLFSGPRLRFTVAVVRLIRARPHELGDIGLSMPVGSASGEEYLDTRPPDQDVELNQVLRYEICRRDERPVIRGHGNENLACSARSSAKGFVCNRSQYLSQSTTRFPTQTILDMCATTSLGYELNPRIQKSYPNERITALKRYRCDM